MYNHAFGTSYPPDGWRVRVPLVATQYAQEYAEVIVTGNTVHTIWIDNRDGLYRLYYKKSSDDGFSWSNDLIISSTSVLANVRRIISISGFDNNLYVAYVSFANPTRHPYTVCFIRSTDNGNTWGNNYTIETHLTYLPELSIVATSDSIRLVYRGGNYIRYRASGNQGANWTVNDILCNTYPDRCPDITVKENLPYVTFVHNAYEYPWWWADIFHARPSGAPDEWVVTNILTDASADSFVFDYPHIVGDDAGYVYVKYEVTPGYGLYGGQIRCAYSSDNGSEWQGSGLNVSGKEGSDMILLSTGSLMVVYGNTLNEVFASYGQLAEPEMIWSEPVKLIDATEGSAAFHKPHCSVAKGPIARHLVFHRGNVGSYDLFYMANDDLLVSNTSNATAFNNGRHLVRDPFSNKLYAVYFSEGRPHYSWSNDNGLSWAPYHILENIHTDPVSKDSGFYPSIGLIPGFFNCEPCLVYVDNENNVEYRYRDLAGEWTGFTILPASSGYVPGPPAVYTYYDQVCVTFSVKNASNSAILYYQFLYGATEPPDPEILDSDGAGPLDDSKATVTVDGNGNPHVAWSKKSAPNDYEDIFYRWHDAMLGWLPPLGQAPFPIVETPDICDKNPHIDCYGPDLSVVWNDEADGVSDEIWRRKKFIPSDMWDLFPANYSLSTGIISEYPVNASHDFTVWPEVFESDYDIRYHSDTYLFGWVSQQPERELFCHSQLQRDWEPWDLYTVWTRGNTTPYYITSAYVPFGGSPPGGGGSPLYSVETGMSAPSAFCVHRDGAITYDTCSVDYSTQELSYSLSFLDPTYPFHQIKGIAYFEGTGNKAYELWVNGAKKFSFVVQPNKAYNFEALIPCALYETAHRISVSVISANGSGVYLAGLKVFRLTSDPGGGGPQSTGDDKVSATRLLVASPNPFNNELKIRLQITDNINRADPCIRIYDVSGRLVKQFKDLTVQNTNILTLTWDGCDDRGRKLPSGVYIVESRANSESMTEKVILSR